MLIFAGLPTFYIELALGQFAALTPHVLYRRMAPIFTGISSFYDRRREDKRAGIGYTMVMASVWSSIYYNIVIAWALRYLWSSFTSDLPFVGCRHEWNTISWFSTRQKKVQILRLHGSCGEGALHRSRVLLQWSMSFEQLHLRIP